MISPHTPPGTEVVCIENKQNPEDPRPALELGGIYTVGAIEPCGCWGDGIPFVLHLQEEPRNDKWGHSLACFRRLDLSGLDKLLTAPSPARDLERAPA
jgi:hypothetical protein